MSKSFIGVSLGGLVLIASSIFAFALGASIGQGAGQSAGHARLVMVSSEVRFEPARVMLQETDDGQTPEGGNTDVFVYQGVLTDSNGDPASGLIDLFFTLESTMPTPEIHSQVRYFVNPDEYGRFQVEIPLADPAVMITFEDLLIDCRETGAMDPIATVPVRFNPRAWTAQHSKTSDTADEANFALEALTAQSATDADNAQNAQNAQNAVSAQTADALTNDITVTLTLNTPFSVYGNGYDAPKATRVGNVVHLSGLVDVDETTNSSIIAMLPVGMWPSERIILSVNTQSTLYNGTPPRRIDVLNNGQVILLQQLNSGQWFSLNGLSFIVD